MSAKRSHSLLELRVRQTRQEGVGAQCRLSDEAWPVRGYDLRDDFMVPRREAGGCKVRADFVAGWEVGVEHGPHRREEVWHDDIVWADQPEELMRDLPRPEDLPLGIDPPRPISVTFIPANVFDNPVLLRVNPEYFHLAAVAAAA